MPVQVQAYGGNVLGRHNAAADTVWYAVVPGRAGSLARVPGFTVTSGNTANAVYGMRPIGRANVATAATTSGAAIVLDADPSPSGNTIAAGDQCVYVAADGTYRRAQVNTSGWDATNLTVTFTASLPANVSSGAKFFNFGVFTDTDPATGRAHEVFETVANTRQEFRFQGGGFKGHAAGDPLLFYCPNATNATVMNFAEFNHSAD